MFWPCHNFDMAKKVRKYALPIAASVIAPGIGTALGSTLSAATLSAIGAGVGSAANTYADTHNLGSSLTAGALGGAGSYIGGNIGSAVGGQSTANVLQNALGPDLGSAVGQLAGGQIALSPANAILGSSIGSNLASSLVPQKTSNPGGAGAFKAKQEKEQDVPASFQSFGQLTPSQFSSNIATQGVYGGGAGPEETSYFLNLINRRLIDDSGRVDKDLSEINPIENSFLSQLGLGGTTNSKDLLEAISRYRTA